ncbi:hypothetical protein P4J10_22935 [Bacillus cereus]|uniref:hypothetical protein n=1 Tax=Bacillus cereus group TaxID=86661 RepID=UPI000B454285|nr:hypothetical protein [Bacillus thuringiensis]MEB9469450.1 hypothetical protein [Bacillus cereus]MRA82341.1 hypothetical protein [Bacillus thuringiensis]OUA18925.1 hypothetical protein BK776_27800 [Bacillus thuringiensis serovar aizawai]
MNKLLAEYKHLIDFKDRMQKNNFKFVEGYLKFQKRKNREGWEDDCIDFLKDAITLQNELLVNIKQQRVIFG